MIIMINGAFGVGKTTISNRLIECIPNSMLYDPEEIGFMLRKVITDNIKKDEEKTDNFQDLQLWKVLTVQVAGLLKSTYCKHLIVPMTICNHEYFQYIFNGLKLIDEQTFHFCLIASEETIYQRLRKRGEADGNWCFQQTKKCVEAYKDDIYQEKIETEGVTVGEIVTNILNKVAH